MCKYVCHFHLRTGTYSGVWVNKQLKGELNIHVDDTGANTESETLECDIFSITSSKGREADTSGTIILFFLSNLASYIDTSVPADRRNTPKTTISRRFTTGACVPVDRVLDSRSECLGLDSHCWSCVEVSGKLLIPYCLCQTSNDGYLVKRKLENCEWHLLQKMC